MHTYTVYSCYFTPLLIEDEGNYDVAPPPEQVDTGNKLIQRKSLCVCKGGGTGGGGL